MNIYTNFRLRIFKEKVEYATAYGYNLPTEVSYHRSMYFKDFQFFLDNLARLGSELKSFPGK